MSGTPSSGNWASTTGPRTSTILPLTSFAPTSLAGQRLAVPGRGARHRDRAGLTAEASASLVHRDVEPALAELLGRAQPADAAAEHRNCR